MLIDHRPALQAAVLSTAMALMRPTDPLPSTPMDRGWRRRPKPAPREVAAPPPRHTRWTAIAAAGHALRAQGTPLAPIARRLGMSRPAV